MQVELKIDIPEGFFNIEAFQSALSGVLTKIAWEAQDFWVTAAGQRLKSSRQEYQNAIKTTGSVLNYTISVALDGGFLPWALEIGTDPYPMLMREGKVAPLNVNRLIIFTSPQIWRTGVGEPWLHPGFPGFNISDDVIEYMAEELVPKYLEEALEKL